MKTHRSFYLSFIVLLCMTGCATLFSKSKYEVRILSNIENASVKIIKNNGKEVCVVTTPAFVELSASDGFFNSAKYTFLFQKNGYLDYRDTMSARVDSWYFGNLVFGGLGLFGFLIVDPLTGAMWRLDDKVVGVLTPRERDASVVPLNTIQVAPQKEASTLMENDKIRKNLSNQRDLGIITEEQYQQEMEKHGFLR